MLLLAHTDSVLRRPHPAQHAHQLNMTPSYFIGLAASEVVIMIRPYGGQVNCCLLAASYLAAKLIRQVIALTFCLFSFKASLASCISCAQLDTTQSNKLFLSLFSSLLFFSHINTNKPFASTATPNNKQNNAYELVSEMPGEGACPYQETQNVTSLFAGK